MNGTTKAFCPNPRLPLRFQKVHHVFYTYCHLSSILLGRAAYENRAFEGALEPLATDPPNCPFAPHTCPTSTSMSSHNHIQVGPWDNERRL